MSEPQPAEGQGQGKIRDRGYVPYQGGYTPEGTRWAVITRRMLRSGAKQAWIIVLAVLALFPALISAVAMFIEARVSTALGHTATLDHYIFAVLTEPYGNLLVAVLMAMFAGGGAIADDARAGAFQFYFARPVTPGQYLSGKVVAVVGFVAVVTLLPTVLLALLRVGIAGSGADALHGISLVLRATLAGTLAAVCLGVPVLALSSLGKRRGYVQGGFAALMFLPWVIGARFVDFTRTPWPALASIPTHLSTVSRALFGLPVEDERAMPLWVSLVALTLVVGGSLALIRRRLAAVEVVAS